MKFQIAMFSAPDNKAFFQEVNGTPTSFKGFEKYKFFIHTDDGIFWKVSEANLGFSVISEGLDSKDAHNKAKQKLDEVGLERFERAYQQAEKELRERGLVLG